jgi:MraZ protein
LSATAIITRGLDGYLSIFDQETWEKRLAQLTALAETKKANREYVRFLTNDATIVEVDAQGRLRLSEELKGIGGLEKDVVFVGSLDHIEIWDQARYHSYMERVSGTIEDVIEGIEGL